MEKLRLIEEEHKYLLADKEVPSVNQILKAEGILPNFYSNNHNCLLGTYTHQAIQLYYRSILDINSLVGEVKERFSGFEKFISDFPEFANPLEVEKPLYSQQWEFAGTPDLIMPGILVDWKVSQNLYDYFSLTMAGYEILYEEFLGHKPEEIWIVRLLPNDYKIDKVKADRQNFLAILLTYKYKKERGLL